VGRLAEEQAALRRVATLVAGEASPAEAFSTVTEELGRLLGADIAALICLEPGNTAIWRPLGVKARAITSPLEQPYRSTTKMSPGRFCGPASPTLQVTSLAGNGTTLLLEVPLGAQSSAVSLEP
jgi:GAF domain-containing protein